MDLTLPRLLTVTVLVLSALTSCFFLSQARHLAAEVAVASREMELELKREPSSQRTGAVPLVSFEEIFANVPGKESKGHTLGIKLDLELFEEDSRRLLDQWQAIVKDAIISTTAEQDYERMSTVAGKLFFKEALVGRINQLFNQAIVRDVHFGSFYLQ